MEWQAFRAHLLGFEDKIGKGEPFETFISDAQTFERKYVKAIVSSSPDKLPWADVLWVRDFKGQIEPVPWAVRIVEELAPPHEEFL